MAKWLLWMQSVRSVLLALRMIAFEKTVETAAGVWSALTLLIVLPLLAVSVTAGVSAAGLMGLLFFPFRRWMISNRYRLIRTADMVEYAETMTDENDYRQRFTAGVVLHRMKRQDVVRTGKYDPERMEGCRAFFMIRSSAGTYIVPAESIVGIEIDALKE